ncbi:MAG: hypothetical protein Q4E48_09065 [Prevotella sp.]|nr:hypothetical protein [Prevotella sp.]
MKQSTIVNKFRHYLSDFQTVFLVWLIMALIPWLRIWLKGKFDLE